MHIQTGMESSMLDSSKQYADDADNEEDTDESSESG
jgi:hypothetical protein